MLQLCTLKPKASGYRRKNLQRLVRLLQMGLCFWASAIRYHRQDDILSNGSDIVGSQLHDHEISKSAIGNRQIGNRKSQTPGKV